MHIKLVALMSFVLIKSKEMKKKKNESWTTAGFEPAKFGLEFRPTPYPLGYAVMEKVRSHLVYMFTDSDMLLLGLADTVYIYT